ncbi:HIT family protein [Candidatus Woesearchaeota archaeon]|nr:HIT family protein [Candidatus Woesearchaeota archaeon]
MPQQQLNEEQVKALQEKLKNMSPEELREFQKKQCIFCQIIAGKVQARKIYEDEYVVAILDINPANPGHVLIMPREHYSIMPQIPAEEIGHIFMVSKALSNACLRALEVQGSNIIVANGVAAGQRAQHFMAHLIPRKENDNLGFQLPQKTISEEELQKIQKVLAGSLGAKTEETKESIPPVPLMPKEKKVLEADFKEVEGKEKKITKSKEERKKKKVKETKKKLGEPKGKKEVSGKQEVDLDDIAKVLGAK